MSVVEPESAGPPVEPATGFWRVARPAGAQRAWLVAPDGQGTFVLGVNAVMRDTRAGGTSRCAGIRDYIRRRPPTTAARLEWARLSDGGRGGAAVRRPYGFNSVGAFSQINDFDDDGGDSYMIRPPEPGGAGAPYMVVLGVSPRGSDRALKDEVGTVLLGGPADRSVGDPFNPLFLADLNALAEREVAPRREDPRLQMWFAGNELGIFDKAKPGRTGIRDVRRWIWSDVPSGSTIDSPLCARHALAAFLSSRYEGSIRALNAAWQSTYPDFPSIVDAGPRPVPGVHDCNASCAADLQQFIHDHLLRAWVQAITRRLRRADPNHLIASPRLVIGSERQFRFWSGPAEPNPDHWVDPPGDIIGADSATVRYSPSDLFGRDGDGGFDLVAINAYTDALTFPRPWFTDGLHKLRRESGLPLIISEFGVRARIDGWSNRGGAHAFVPHHDQFDDQRQRGRRYQTQIDQFIGFRDVVGAVWHAWSDRFIPTDPSRQINLGLVRCSDPRRHMQAGRRWDRIDALIAETNRTINQRIAAKTGY